MSNRGEVVAVDIQGFRDNGENDGPFKDEKQTRETDADIIWRYDMMDELGVFQHNMANSSPVVHENLIYVSTSNGQDESHVNVPSPKSPAIIALDKTTGKLVWEDASPGANILHGQWSSPAVGKIGDTFQVVIGQGDGWVRSYEAKTGKKLWEFDMNPKDSVWPKTRNEVISTPVIYEGVVYIANGQDPEHGEGVGHLYAIDPTKTGDITKSGMIWHYDKIRRSISTGAIYNGILFYSDFSGFLHALDVKTGQALLDARHVRGHLGLAHRHWRQGISRRRGRRRHGPQRRPDDESRRREQHGELGLLDARPRQRRALHRQPQRAVRNLQHGRRRKQVSARSTAAVATVLVTVAALSAQAPASAPADRWTQFRGTPALLGTSDAKLPSTLKVLWTYEAGDAIESSAAIVDGVVYVGSQTGELHAVNLADGKLKWKYKASPDGIGESSPTVAGGLVYIGDLTGVVHAVQIASGQVAWTFKTSTEIKSSPVVSGDKVLIGSYDSNLYALGARDGKLAWKVQTEGYVHATPAIVDGVAYIAGCDEILRGIRISDGVEVFKMPFGAYTGASPAVVDGRAYFGTYENDVLAVDLKAKKIVWSYKHPERSFPFYSSPAVLGDRVVVGGRDKMVHALDRKTGKALWTFATGARVDSSPVVSGGLAYVGSNDGKLYVLDVATGKSVFQFEAGGPLSASPALASGRLVIGSQDGKLFCLG